MPDDVEATLASLERRLRALQAELDAEEPPAEPPPAEPEPRAGGTERPPAAEPVGDALDRFGAELRRLVGAWERTVAEVRGGEAEAMVFRGGVALEARGDLPALCALDRALRDIPEVASTTLRAYAGGAAALEVALEGEVALVAELRRALVFELIDAREGRVTLAVG